MRNMEDKTLNDLGATIREVSREKENLGGSRTIKGGSRGSWCWPWGSWGYSKGA